MAAYLGNRAEAATRLIETDPVASAVLTLMANRSCWSGTATDLDAILRVMMKNAEGAKGWPATPRILSTRLRHLDSSLAKVGITVAFDRTGHDRARLITISARQRSVAAAAEVPTKTEQTLSSAPSAAKEDSQLTGSANEDPDPRIVASDSEPRPQVESDDANNVTAPADAADAENDEKSKVVVQATMKGGSRQSGGLALVRFGMGKVRGRADDKMTLATEGNPNLKYQRVGRQEMQSRT
jgi:hypothetical protein